MKKSELTNIIADFIMYSKDTVLEAIEKDDTNIIRDEAYEYLNNCDTD